jgi:hypothetical protein
MMYALELMKNQLSSATKPPRGLRAKANLLHDSDFGIVNKKAINDMADFVKKNNNNNGKRNNSRKPNNNVPKDFGSKREVGIKAPDVCAGTIEYKMGKVMAEQILNDAKTKSGKLPKPAQEILCDYVNRECGLKGFCVRVLVDAN